MEKELFELIIDEYPEYHLSPFRLSLEEIKNPYLVMEDFFKMYSLSDARICLKQLLFDALQSTLTNHLHHYKLHDFVERMVEAAWVLFQKNNPPGEGEEAEPGN